MVAKEDLQRYFNATFPVGPVEAPAIGSEKEIQQLIFDEHNDLYKSMNHEITLIIGRKGSGKTSLLNSVWFENHSDKSLIVPLDSGTSADIFSRIIEEIDALSSDTALVEQVSNVWEVLIWGVVLRLLYDQYRDEAIGRYIDGFGIKDSMGSPYELIDLQLTAIKKFPPTARPVPQKVRYTKVNDITFLEVRERAVEILQKANRTVYVLMDSLEEYVLHKNENSAALAGLLRCVGKLTSERIPLVFRCCVPAEKYHDLMKLSQNPIKDFQGSILLHWDAGDLVKLSAQRYAEYLETYHPDFFKKHMSNLDLQQNRKDAFKFWSRIFPSEIKNRNGVLEHPIAYILRHTQLLPRHFLLILTEILRRSIKIDRQPVVSAEHIIDGVFEAEGKIKDQVMQAFRTPLEHAEAACQQLLRELPTHFTWQDFDNVISQRRRDSIKALDKWELMALLIEIGAVGKFIKETDKYFVAAFEYMVPHRLSVSLRDTFCIHPLFTVTYGANTRFDGVKPVYTYWSETIPDELT